MTAPTAARPTRSTRDAGKPLPPMSGADVATAIRMLEHFLAGRTVGWIAEQLEVPRHRLVYMRQRLGWPDKEAMRRNLTDLKARPPVDGPDHPAVEMTRMLTIAARENDARLIEALLLGLDEQAKVEVILAYAVKDSPDRDPADHMEWYDLPPHCWSNLTLGAELARSRAGAHDATAKTAEMELRRRMNASKAS